MITLYNKDFTINYGTINTTIEAFVEEERNGLFELSFIMLNTDNIFNYVKEENIVVTNANDTLLNQKFRIYMTRKLMNNRVEVFARHISFDLMYDYIDNLSFTNQSCQYVLNQLFINSSFSKHYKGYSDIVNAQNYKMSMANILEAIGGKSGSVIDTFGNGAEILRDNENIHVLNRRGYDNEVTIEYRKNLTGFELEEDTTDLVTRILPYAKYNDAETSEEITVKASFVDSPLINNYSHPYIKAIDYSERFDDEEIPTEEKLINLAKKEYNINKVDVPKQNFKIDFIPLSKCVGYEGLEDKINICDTVTIIDTRYGINTQAKVIKTVFNVLKNRYESIELGDPKTTLGDIIGSGGDNEPIVGPPGPPGPAGEDGNLGDFPNSLPATPILESLVYGFSNIELSWTFENKIYYQYELYASKVKDFSPNTFDLIFQGQASSYMFQAKPNETWYFKVCGINTYGERTEFSNQATVTTTKIEDLSNYVENMAIGEALIGKLSLDRGWIGKLNANLLDVKGNFSVTDGNGKRTLDIDSFGNVNLDVSSLKISAKNVATQDYTNNTVNTAKNELNQKYTEIKQTVDSIDITGKVSFSDLSNAGWSTINGANISTGTLKVDKLSSNNENPIITLFGGCAIDATSSNNKGQGSSIRFKWDDYDYLKIGSDVFDIYTWSGGTSPTFRLYGGPYTQTIQTQAGTITINNQGLKWNGTNVSLDGHTHTYYWDNLNGRPSFGTGYGQIAHGNHTHSNYSLTSHTHSYASSSHGHDVLGTGNAKAITEYASVTDRYTLRKHTSSTMDLGTTSHRWGTVYSNSSLNTSDRKYKEDIKYLDDKILFSNSDQNALFLDFIKNDFKPVIYKYKNKEENKYETDKQIGFIANDIIDTEVGKTFLYNFGTKEDTDIMFSPTGYTTVVAKALQEEIQKREELEKEVFNLKNELESIKELIKNMKEGAFNA